MTTDNESEAGSWAREMRARGLHECKACGWVGAHPSVTDDSQVVMRDNVPEWDRVHRLVCPRCFKLLEEKR